jgi:hypothetical protein
VPLARTGFAESLRRRLKSGFRRALGVQFFVISIVTGLAPSAQACGTILSMATSL